MLTNEQIEAISSSIADRIFERLEAPYRQMRNEQIKKERLQEQIKASKLNRLQQQMLYSLECVEAESGSPADKRDWMRDYSIRFGVNASATRTCFSRNIRVLIENEYIKEDGWAFVSVTKAPGNNGDGGKMSLVTAR